MPKLKIENKSQAKQGFYTGSEMVFIEPGQERTVTVYKRDLPGIEAMKKAKVIGFETVGDDEPGVTIYDNLGDAVVTEQVAADPLDHDHDGRKGGSVPVQQPVETAPAPDRFSNIDAASIDSMSDDDLHAFIETKTGRKAHSATSRDNLVIKAKGLLAPQQ